MQYLTKALSLKYILIAFSALFFSTNMLSQEAADEGKNVEMVIETMFEGMRLGDSAMVSQLIRHDAEFFSAFMTKQGKSELRQGSVQNWLDAIGTPRDNVWNEEWWDPVIKVDGNFAHAWVPYAFYVDDDFSHCGVDSFHFIKDDNGKWLVYHLTDTRRKGGCETFIPEAIKAKHSK